MGLGPYPVSMLTVEGEAVSNSNPTRITMAFLGMAQAGVVLLAEPALKRLLQRPQVWFVTVLINQRIMTWFLWHLTALVALSGLLLSVGGPWLNFVPLSGAWWATRPVWFAICAVVTVALIAVFGRLENPSIDLRPAPSTWRPALATIAVCGGLAVMAKSGIVSGDGVHWIWPVLPVVALLALRVVPLRILAPRG